MRLFATGQLIGEPLESTFSLGRRALMRTFKLLLGHCWTSLLDRVELRFFHSATSDTELCSSQSLEWKGYRFDIEDILMVGHGTIWLVGDHPRTSSLWTTFFVLSRWSTALGWTVNFILIFLSYCLGSFKSSWKYSWAKLERRCLNVIKGLRESYFPLRRSRGSLSLSWRLLASRWTASRLTSFCRFLDLVRTLKPLLILRRFEVCLWVP